MTEVTVSKNSKSLLARLLAEENIRVEHSSEVVTASFNVETRLLLLPIWKDESYTPDIYDLFVGHEVAHALYTPSDLEVLEDAMKRSNHAFLNVVEDARIEKLMKRKFQGLQAPFKNAYQDLYDRDFFSLKGQPIQSRNFIDRINLFFKLRYALNLYAPSIFNSEEMLFIRRIDDAETYSEVADICEDLYKYLKEKQEEQPQQQMSPSESGGDNEPQDGETQEMPSDEDATEFDETSASGEGEEESDETPEESSEESNGEETNQKEQKSTTSSDDKSNPQDGQQTSIRIDEFSSETSQSLEDNLKDMVNENARESVYINLHHNYEFSDYIHDYKEVQSDFEHQISALDVVHRQQFSHADAPDLKFPSLKELISENSKTISYLVKEFEMKKAARAQALSSEAKTGAINTSKLWSYQVNEDIFLRKTNTPDGKNHGMVMVVDWSGSMGSTVLNTVKQTIVLATFCKRVGIPFEVYNFTSVNRKEPSNGFPELSKFSTSDIVLNNIALRNTLSSRMSGKVFNQSCQNYLNIAAAVANQIGSYYIPYRLRDHALSKDQFGATPTNQALVLLDRVIPKFRKENSLEKVNLVLLTDGEPTDHLSYKYDDGEYPCARSTRYASNIYVRDTSTNETYRMTSESDYSGIDGFESSKFLIKILREKHGINSIGFYLLGSYGRNEIKRIIQRFVNHNLQPYMEEYRNLRKEFNRDNFFVATNSGHNEYYIINAKVDPKTDELNVNSSMSKSAIAKNFMSHNKSKVVNRQLLNKFVDLVK
tara:strand:+ start:24444 stop:26747 length:2304 start_codon:yes stop_codon:yes gene_type:complete